MKFCEPSRTLDQKTVDASFTECDILINCREYPRDEAPSPYKDFNEVLDRFERPCLLCAPKVGEAMHRRGRNVAILDIDTRFASLPGFVEWSIYRPSHLEQCFDLILCDPPFFNVSLGQLFKALRMLSHFDLSQKLMVSYLTRRADAVTATFAPFGLRSTGYHPGYQTVQRCAKNEIEFFANFDLPEGWTDAHD